MVTLATGWMKTCYGSRSASSRGACQVGEVGLAGWIFSEIGYWYQKGYKRLRGERMVRVMFLTFEISRPIQFKPWWYKSQLTIRCGWLWFAAGWHPLREDELHGLIKAGATVWGGE